MNTRNTRHRPESTLKYGAFKIAENRDFAKEIGEFGLTYIRKYEKDLIKQEGKELFVFPNVEKILEGLLQWMTRQIEDRLKGESLNLQKKIIKNSRSTFEVIFGTLEFSRDQMKKPIEESHDPILGASNPRSKVSCLVLQLYSMEIGST